MPRFQLKLKNPDQPPPVQDPPPLAKRPEKTLASRGDASSSGSSSTPVVTQQCHAYLSAFQPAAVEGSLPVSSFANPARYAVIGRGFAATTNLATMRCSGKRRFSPMTLCMIGKDDPWKHYVSHDMNQEFELLCLPAYSYHPVRPPPGPARRWLDSLRFADCNARELAMNAAHFMSWPGSEIVDGAVTRIERSKVEDKELFTIHLEGGRTILARNVDICTGTGQQTYAEAGGTRGIAMCAALWQEYLTPPEGTQPRICSAEMFVTGKRQVRPGASVLITSANSPAGIQAGEHALGLDRGSQDTGPAAEVLLIASEKMAAGFLPIGRLDGLARTAGGPLPVRLHHPIAEELFPTDEAMWFADYYRPASIDILDQRHVDAFLHADDSPIDPAGIGKKLLVTFKDTQQSRLVRGAPLGTPIGPAEPTPLVYGLFDQVVISTGRARGGRGKAENEPGSAMQLVWTLASDLADELKPIVKENFDFPVGLATASGNLRILGAAGINNPVYTGNQAGRDQLKAFEDSLPWQARVNGEGVTLAAVTIAIANDFFPIKPNDCLNTATRRELKRLLGDDLGDAVFLARHQRVRPFQSADELLRVLAYYLNIDAVAAQAQVARLNDYAGLLSEVSWRKYVYPDNLLAAGFKPVRDLMRRIESDPGSLKMKYDAVVEASRRQ